MQPLDSESFYGLYSFLCYFGASIVLLALFCVAYLRVTPYPELRLVREGKSAPAVSFGGAMIGFVLPLASAISNSVGLEDMLVWALVALIVQVLVFLVLRMIFSSLVRDIADDRMGAAILLALFSIATGMLNAACMTW